jgi:ATP-binding cassette subfamily B (MDR/TAP) protein 1
MSTILPCIATMGVVMSKSVSRYMQSSRRHVSDGGSLAEEVISTIRTAQAFGTQKILADIYDTYINQSKAADAKAAVTNGAGMATFFFILYSSYGLTFSFGTTLINEGHGK